MRSTSRWLAGLALLLVVAVVVLLLQASAPDVEPAPRAAASSDSHAELPQVKLASDAAAQLPATADEVASGLLPASLAAASVATRVSGRVVDGAHRPLTGVRVGLGAAPSANFSGLQFVLAGDRQQWVTSGEDGRFLIEQPADGLQLLLLAAADGPPKAAAMLSVVPGVSLDLGDVVLRDPLLITGRVEDELGQPVSDAEVLVTDAASCARALIMPGTTPMQMACWSGNVGDEEWIESFVHALGWSVQTRTDESGHYTVRAWSPADMLFAAARKQGYTIAMHAPPFSVGFLDEDSLTEMPVLVACHATGRISGRVVTADGSAPNIDIVVTAESTAVDPPHPTLGQAVHAAPDGRFEIEGLVPGPHDLQATTTDRRLADGTARTGASDVRLVLCERPRILVHVTRDGAPVSPCEVLVGRRSPLTVGLGIEATWEPHAVTSASGTLSLEDLPLDDLTLQAFADGACSWPERVNAWRGQPHPDITLELQPAGILRGVVIDAESEQPLADAVLEVHSQGPIANDRAVSSADGTFSLGPLPFSAARTGRSFSVRVYAAGYFSTGLNTTVDTSAPCVLRLQRRTLVQLRAGSGLRAKLGPLEQPIVRVVNLDRDAELATEALPPTGLFLDVLVPGRYHAKVDGFEDAGADFTVRAGELAVVDL